ncbi:Hemicentin-1 [Halotydeus destructor]|nr:Hemicentin-1 [Halotydeus destructor]
MKDNKPLYDDRVKILSNEAFAMTSLAIEKLESSDAGNYTCKAENAAGQDTHSLQLIIKQTLKWKTEPKDVTAAVGQDVSIECSATGLPSPTITWYNLNQSRTQMPSTGKNLKLNDISSTTAGMYECVAFNGVGQELRKTIKVSVNASDVSLVSMRHRRASDQAPEILKRSNEPFRLQEEEKFAMTCTLSKGTNPVQFAWMKDGLPLNDGHVKVRTIEDLLISTLIIERLKSSDAGNYTCTAQNAFGQDSHSLQLLIKHTPKWITEPQDVQALIGQDISIDCSASGSPMPTVTWFKLNQSIKHNLLSGSQLRLNIVSVNSAGLYECVADNGVDEVLKKTIRVSSYGFCPNEALSLLGVTWVSEMKMVTKLFLIVLVSLNISTIMCVQHRAESLRVKARREVADKPEILKPFSNLELRRSETFTFMCSLRKGTRPINFTWLKDGTSLTNSNAKITNIGEVSLLTIDKSLESDAGNYTCKAQNTAGYDSHMLRLVVKQTPQWLVEPQDVIGIIGQDIAVECSASGSPTPRISWLKVDQDKRKLFEGSYLRLNQISNEAIGLYECVADNGVDEVLRKTVRVSVNGRKNVSSLVTFLRDLQDILVSKGKMVWSNFVVLLIVSVATASHAMKTVKSRRAIAEPPQISRQSSILPQQENSKFTVMCSLSKGSNPVRFTWFKNNKPLKDEDVKIVHLEALSASSLSIEVLKSSDAGNYTCKAENSVGQDSHSLQLTIKHIPRFVKQPQDVITAIGQDVTVECSATGSPMPVITWLKLNGPIKRKLQGDVLRFNHISNEDAGMYECVADNGVDKALKKTFRVSVNGKHSVVLSYLKLESSAF